MASPKKSSTPREELHTVLIDIPKYFILGGLVTMLVILIWIILPFLPAVVIGAVIATGFYPVHRKIANKVKRRTIAATISTLILLTIILVPVTWFVTYTTNQAIDTYNYLETRIGDFIQEGVDIQLLPEMIKESRFGEYMERVSEFIPVHTEDVIGYVVNIAQNLISFLLDTTTKFASGIPAQLATFVVQVFMFVLSMYFFLRDGDRVIGEIKELLPLPKKYRNVLFKKLQEMSQGIIYGIFGAAVVQGLFAGIGFAIAGINNAAFWGTVMTFFAIVPYVGSSMIWFPAALILLFTKHWVAGIFLLAWGMLIVSTVDNLIKPYIIGEKARIHPLLAFLVILGGLFTMGLPGLIVAPYLLSIALTFIHIYKLEYHGLLEENRE